VGGCIAVTYHRTYRDDALRASTTERRHKAPGRAGTREILKEKRRKIFLIKKERRK